MPTEASIMIIILEVALIIKLSGLCWAQYKENKRLRNVATDWLKKEG